MAVLMQQYIDDIPKQNKKIHDHHIVISATNSISVIILHHLSRTDHRYGTGTSNLIIKGNTCVTNVLYVRDITLLTNEGQSSDSGRNSTSSQRHISSTAIQ